MSKRLESGGVLVSLARNVVRRMSGRRLRAVLRSSPPPVSAAAIALAAGRKRLTTAELAELWNVAAGTLKNWRACRPRRGPRFIRVGGAVRYRVSDVAAYERKWASK